MRAVLSLLNSKGDIYERSLAIAHLLAAYAAKVTLRETVQLASFKVNLSEEIVSENTNSILPHTSDRCFNYCMFYHEVSRVVY